MDVRFGISLANERRLFLQAIIPVDSTLTDHFSMSNEGLRICCDVLKLIHYIGYRIIAQCP